MKPNRLINSTLLAACLLAACSFTGPALAQLLPEPPLCPPPADEYIASMGAFIVWVAQPYRPVVEAQYTNRGWDPATNHWTSLALVDEHTKIGYSCVHLDDDATDTGGATVGTAGTLVKDSDFALVPTVGFTEGPPGTREVHTEIVSLDAWDPTCTVRLRAGIEANVAPRTLGEVEDKNPDPTLDFPAESFFAVYFEVDVPFYGNSTLYNPDPVLLVADELNQFPPRTIYYHGETEAVAMYFKNGDEVGKLFGYLRLAGHGAQFQCCDPQYPTTGERCEVVWIPDCPGNPMGWDEFTCGDEDALFDGLEALAKTSLMPCDGCIDEEVDAWPPWWWILIIIIVVLLIVIIILIIKR